MVRECANTIVSQRLARLQLLSRPSWEHVGSEYAIAPTACIQDENRVPIHSRNVPHLPRATIDPLYARPGLKTIGSFRLPIALAPRRATLSLPSGQPVLAQFVQRNSEYCLRRWLGCRLLSFDLPGLASVQSVARSPRSVRASIKLEAGRRATSPHL